MNNKTNTRSVLDKANTWAAQVGSREVSEAIQRIAFSFGYNWAGQNESNQSVQLFDIKVLYFHIEGKKITYGASAELTHLYASKVCKTIDDVINAFKNSPLSKKVIGDTEIYEDGTVVFGHTKQNAMEFDEVVKVRNEFLERKDTSKNRRLPIVNFLYESPTSGRLVREVMILEDLGDTYACLDMKDGNAFKQFRKDRIYGRVTFYGLSESKEW